MKKFFFKSLAVLFLCNVTLATANAQFGPNAAAVPNEPVDTTVISKLKDESMNHSKVMETMSWLTDVYGPRLTGSPQLKRASEWSKEQFENWGLQNVHLESWGEFGKGWELERYSLTASSPYVSFSVISYPKAWSVGTERPVKAEVVYLDAKSEEDFAKYKGKLKGKFVMIVQPKEVKPNFDPIGKRYEDKDLLKLANATVVPSAKQEQLPADVRKQMQLGYIRSQFLFAEKPLAILDETYRGTGGSVALMAATLPVAPGTPFDKRPTAYGTDAPPVLTQISINQEHYGRLYRLLQKGIKVELELDMKVKFNTNDTKGYNVIAEIPGTDPALKDEVVMIGAHLDSWHSGTGATDNGAGSGTVLEAARLLKAAGIQPKRTIRFALWTGEEQGLLGSRGYVKQHYGDVTETPVKYTAEQEKFAAYFNLDNGTGQIRGIYLQQNEACRPIFRTWLEPFKDWNATTVSYGNTGGTDHLSFDAANLPAFQFIQDPIEYSTWTHHSNMDTYERIQEEDMKRNAVIMASFAYQAAQREAKLPRKPSPVKVGVK